MSIFGGNTPATTQQPQSQPSAFGNFANPTTTQANFATGFGTAPTQTNAGGGFGLFGTAATTQANVATGFGTNTGGGFGSFGTAPTQANVATGFGTNAGSGFGSSGTATTTTSAFGTFGTRTTQAHSGSSFGQPSFGGASFNSTAGQAQAVNLGFGSSFGTTTGTTQANQPSNVNFQTSSLPSTSGLMNPTEQSATAVTEALFRNQAAIHNSVFTCYVFGDERDGFLSNLNYIQSCFGTGKGYFSPNSPPASITSENNSLYRFVGITYSHLFNETNQDGKIMMRIRKPLAKVWEEEAQLLSTLHSLIGVQEVFFTVSSYDVVDENTTVVILYADDKNTLRRYSANEFASLLLQPHVLPLIQKLGIVGVQPKIRPSEQQIKDYLDIIPLGINMEQWKKALDENPDPVNMIPTLILGPDALKSRIIAQRNQSNLQLEVMKRIEVEVTSLHKVHSNYGIIIPEIRRRHTLMTHRLVLVLLKMLSIQNGGLPIQPGEVNLIPYMEQLSNEFSANGGIGERLKHLTEHSAKLLRESSGNDGTGARERWSESLEKSTLEQIKKYLVMQQASIKEVFAATKRSIQIVAMLKESIDKLSLAHEERRKDLILESLQ